MKKRDRIDLYCIIVMGLGIILAIASFLCPFYFAFKDGALYLLLFFVSWIPATGIIVLAYGLSDFIENINK